MSPEDYRRARDFALKRLNARECSAHEVYQYLVKREVAAEIASQLVAEFKEKDFINDERFMRIIIRYYGAQGKGPNLIKQKLKLKGIPIDLPFIISLLRESSEYSESNLIRQFVNKRYGNFPDNPKMRKKVYDALIRRGFSYSVIREALSVKPQSIDNTE